MSRPPAQLNQGLIARGQPASSPDVPTLYYADPARGGDGSYVVNGNKADVQWRWRSAASNQIYSVPLPAGGLTPGFVALPGPVVDAVIDFSAQGGGSGDSEVQHFWGNTVSGRRFAVQPKMGPPVNKYICNVPISSNLVFGTAQLPGYLSSPLKAWANSDLRFNAQSLGNHAEVLNLGAFVRAYDDTGCPEAGDCRRRAWLEEVNGFLPGWIGPQDRVNADLTGPEIQIPPYYYGNPTIDIRFPGFTDCDFLAEFLLDDSTSTTGMEPLLSAVLIEEDTRETLTDGTSGISWRDFMACPTVNVAGFPSGGTIRAMSLKTPRGGWSQQVRRTSAMVLRVTTSDPGIVTFRAAIHGHYVGYPEPSDRRYAPSVDRRTSMPGAAAGLGGGIA